MNGYKYRANIAVNDKGNLRDIETLIKDELWASSLTDLNDPFEATYIDNIERALALFESVFGANIKDVKKYWEELILFKNNIGIYSLALSQADYPDNELMWAHYANSHKGFCIEYDIEKLQDSENYTFDVNRMKIEYKNEPPIIGLDDIYNKDGFLIKMFGTKSKSWEYENEIRLIYSTSKRKEYNPFALKSIYFGLNMDEKHQMQIIEGLANRDIRFYKMQRKAESYKLIPILIHENKRIIKNKLLLSQYEILKENHNHAVENFHVLYKGESMNKEVLHNFVLKFREEYTKKNANIYVYNKSDIANLIDKYPLNDKEAELLLSCTIAESWFTNPTEVYVNLS